MISLIISIYKNLPGLDLILKSLQKQTFSNFEVIIAEDSRDELTKMFIADQKTIYNYPITHISHEDIAFRKTKINNDAIRISKGEKLVFIDGDCILHPKFLACYNSNITRGKYFYGRRVMLGSKFTEMLYNQRSLQKLNLINILFSDSHQTQEAIYFSFRTKKASPSREIWGCNWGVLKEYMIGINGFDEDYSLPCFGEDLDVGWRLKGKYNLELSSLKNKAIQYHLHHPMNWDAQIEARGRVMFDFKRKEGKFECLNGINKLK